MKLHQIALGKEYLTLVSGALVRVRVTGERHETGYGYRNAGTQTRTKFRCQRVDNGQHLPKSRTPAALRPVPQPAPCARSGCPTPATDAPLVLGETIAWYCTPHRLATARWHGLTTE